MRRPEALRVSANHRRGITTTLTFLDEALCEVEEWAEGRERVSVLHRERNRLTPQQRRALRAEIGRVRRLLREVQDSLGLTASTRDAAQAIWGCCSNLREHIVELEAKHLRRYGKVSAELAAFVDPHVEELLGHFDRILSIVSPPPEPTDAE